MKESYILNNKIYNVDNLVIPDNIGISYTEMIELIRILDISIYSGEHDGLTPDTAMVKLDENNNIIMEVSLDASSF